MASKKYNLAELKLERAQWIDIPVEVVPANKRSVFAKRKMAVDMYIDGVNYSDIYSSTGIAHTHLSGLITKCLTRDETGNTYGYRAIIPRVRLHSNDGDGTSNGLFSKLLLRYPTLAEYIKGCWFGDRKYTMEHHMNLITLHHDYFLKECERLGVQDYEYPFNTVSQGYVSLGKYVKSLKGIDASNRAKRSSKDERQKLMSTGIGARYTKIAIAPFSEVQVDGHKIDLLYVVEYTEEDGTVSKNIATRAWFFPVLDTATRCVIGYSVSQETNYNQYDVIRAVKNAILPHEKIKFTVPGLEYPENGGFPSDIFPETKYAYFDRIMLDNAKSHLSNLVIERMTKTLKAVMDFGSVATPETRGIVERFFGSLETRGFHKLSMTTGSSTRDLKRKDAEKIALKCNLTFDIICELLEVLIAQYNNTPHSSLGNRTPLECMSRRIREAGLYPSIADEGLLVSIRKLDNLFVERTVRGGKNGKRAYITYEGAEYRSNELSVGDRYIGHKITLEVNPNDISRVNAYGEDGTFIGVLKAKGEYGRKLHSLKTRKAALEHARERGRDKSEFDTPITALTQHLDQQAKKSRRAATRGDIVRREMGEEPPSKKVRKSNEISTIDFGRTLSDKANYNNLPTPEERRNMSSAELIEIMYGKEK